MNNKFNPQIFLDFEKRHNCFDKEIGGVHFWDIIRYELYLDILRNIKPDIIKTNKKESQFTRATRILKQILSFIYFLIFTKCEFLFLTSSRNKIGDDGFFDRNLGDILNICKEKSILFEKFQINSSTWHYRKNTLFDPSIHIKSFLSKFVKRHDYSQILISIHKEFEHCNFTNEKINEMVVNYKTDLLFYNFIFKIKKPKICFVNQNGIQKGLFSAAEKCKVPVVEVQHCVIDEGNPAYHYSKDIEYKTGQIYLPTYFFTYSSYWNDKANYPVKRIITIGNSYLYNPTNVIINDEVLQKNGLVVASANIYGENLKKIVTELAEKNSKIPIYFKLHPNQFVEREYYIAELSSFKNIQVITSEKNMEQLLLESVAILVIQSTTIYEALHLRKKGIIYKKQSYEGHRSLFHNPNVYLVDTVEEIINAINQPFVEKNVNEQFFFKDFDVTAFKRFLSEKIVN
ncbi:hypothetical protein [Pedobacter sp.]|uniref:capsular polysaccharide export protein, LipB/KpsS family n=1 Tax=Pedobacter sp. TaxID=1411316 RepID=UPI003BABA014